MTTTHDELAGVVDLFGALTRAELAAALEELAFKQGQKADREALRSEIEAAIEAYALVEYEPTSDEPADDHAGGGGDETEPLLAVGPTAFPTLPANAEDLPHILDYDRRTVDRERLADDVRQRLTADAEAVVAADDADRATALLDVSYDIETWAAVDVAGVRTTLEPLVPQD